MVHLRLIGLQYWSIIFVFLQVLLLILEHEETLKNLVIFRMIGVLIIFDFVYTKKFSALDALIDIIFFIIFNCLILVYLLYTFISRINFSILILQIWSEVESNWRNLFFALSHLKIAFRLWPFSITFILEQLLCPNWLVLMLDAHRHCMQLTYALFFRWRDQNWWSLPFIIINVNCTIIFNQRWVTYLYLIALSWPLVGTSPFLRSSLRKFSDRFRC